MIQRELIREHWTLVQRKELIRVTRRESTFSKLFRQYLIVGVLIFLKCAFGNMTVYFSPFLLLLTAC